VLQVAAVPALAAAALLHNTLQHSQVSGNIPPTVLANQLQVVALQQLDQLDHPQEQQLLLESKYNTHHYIILLNTSS
jgi:hypothetical protein